MLNTNFLCGGGWQQLQVVPLVARGNKMELARAYDSMKRTAQSCSCWVSVLCGSRLVLPCCLVVRPQMWKWSFKAWNRVFPRKVQVTYIGLVIIPNVLPIPCRTRNVDRQIFIHWWKKDFTLNRLLRAGECLWEGPTTTSNDVKAMIWPMMTMSSASLVSALASSRMSL